MQWIEGIGRQNGRLVANAITQSGDRHVVPLADMPSPLKKHSTHRRKISTDLVSWTKASSAEYLAGLNFTPEVTEGHRVFAFTHNGTRYFVPSLVLMRAFFRPVQHLSKYLFAPQGLSQATLLQVNGTEPSVLGLSSLKVEKKYSSTLQALSWYWSFPSAHDCWHSVYTNAAKGNLSMDLPIGTLNCVVQGVKRDSIFHVTGIVVLEVATNEKPFAYAAAHPQVIAFRDKVGKATIHASHDTHIVQREDEWALSNVEWETVKPLIDQGKQQHNQKHELRKIVDLIVEKMGTGTPWRNSSSGTISWNAAQRHYRKWTVDGRWDSIRNALIQLRGRSSDLT